MDPAIIERAVTIVPPAGTTFLDLGFSAHIYITSDSRHVIKRPKPGDNIPFRELVEQEREVYELLGDHPGIIQYHGVAEDKISTILTYANGGNLSDYIDKNSKPDQQTLFQMIQRLAETLLYIHSLNVTVRDIKTDNVLVHNGELKLSDFADGAIYPDLNAIPLEEIQLDLLGIGCVIYSLSKWTPFHYDYYDTGAWPTSSDLRPTSNLPFQSTIEKCWYRQYSSAADLCKDISTSTSGLS